MSCFSKIINGVRLLYDSDFRWIYLANRGRFDGLDDETFLYRKYKACMGKELNLASPKTFNEKLQWLKLYDHKPEYTMMVDKYAVRKYIADTIGEEYLIPLLGVWDNPDDIDFDALPKQFVLKCNHNSGLGMCICKDKSKLDIEKVKAGLRKGLKQDYYLTCREWPYKNVKRRIIAEEYMSDEGKEELSDYKVLCFNGEAKLIEVHKGRFYGNHTADNYDEFWNKTDIEQYDLPKSDDIMPKPAFLEEMLYLSKLLSKNLIHVRVDWYFTNNRLYFGELTFFDGSGYNQFCGDADEFLGSLIKLPIK